MQQQQQQEESAVLSLIMVGQQMLHDLFVNMYILVIKYWLREGIKKERLEVLNNHQFFTPVCSVICQIQIPNTRTMYIDKKIN